MSAIHRYFAALLPALLLLSMPARAEEDFGCLVAARGKVVRWDSDWQKDRLDHDVRYRITNVQINRPRAAPPEMIVSLEAIASAQTRSRKATIVRALAAQLFCGRIEAEEPTRGVLLAVGGAAADNASHYEIDGLFPTEEVSAADLSFRRIVETHWVPAAPGAQVQFVCTPGPVTYACSRHDYERVQRELSQLKKKVTPTWKYLLQRKYLRHTEQGWVQAAPVDVDPDATLSTCVIAGREYSCLSKEKQAFAAELKDATRLVELEAKVFPPPAPAKPGPKPRSAKSGNQHPGGVRKAG